MASSHVYSSIKAQLQAHFSPLPVVDWDTIDDAIEQQKHATSFLAIEEVYADEGLAAFGDPSAICLRETGAIAVHCFVAAPESGAAARVLADQVQDALRFKVVSGIRITDTEPSEPYKWNSGLWTAARASVDYEYDYFRSR